MNFWIGGIIGAAVAVYVMRDNDGRVRTKMKTILDTASEVVRSYAENVRAVKLTNDEPERQEQPTDMSQVQEWVQSDPEARKQVEQILNESEHS